MHEKNFSLFGFLPEHLELILFLSNFLIEMMILTKKNNNTKRFGNSNASHHFCCILLKD